MPSVFSLIWPHLSIIISGDRSLHNYLIPCVTTITSISSNSFGLLLIQFTYYHFNVHVNFSTITDYNLTSKFIFGSPIMTLTWVVLFKQSIYYSASFQEIVAVEPKLKAYKCLHLYTFKFIFCTLLLCWEKFKKSV